MLGQILYYFRPYNPRICEWILSIYSVARILENWGVPVFCDKIAERQVFGLLARRPSQAASMTNDKAV